MELPTADSCFWYRRGETMGNIIDVNNICVNCMHTMDETTRYCPSCGYERGTYVNNPHQLPVFTILQGRYLIGKCLGEGGFGITYLALDLISGQCVAIKELFVQGLLNRQKGKTVLIESSQESRRYYHICKDKFLHEAQLLHNLKDKRGVVNFLNYFEENNTAYIVMEYLEGQDLSQYLKEHNNRISFHETFQFLRPVMKSLIDMNESGVYHRDIAPDNIRYLKSGWMKIMDLGGAKYSFQEQVNGPSRMIAVKKGYAPPEQYQQSYKIGPWMDVYAMAATFYRCVTGKVPQESLSRLEEDHLEKPGHFCPDLNSATEKVILKGLALRTEDRYMDMRSFYEAIKAANPDTIDKTTVESSKHLIPRDQEEESEENKIRQKNKTVQKIAMVCTIIFVILMLIGFFL